MEVIRYSKESFVRSKQIWYGGTDRHTDIFMQVEEGQAFYISGPDFLTLHFAVPLQGLLLVRSRRS